MSQVLLSDLVFQHLGEEVIVPFRAMNGHRVEVTAVLERTAVVHDGDITAKRLVRLDSLKVRERDVIFKATPKTAWLIAGKKGRESSLRTTASQQRWNGRERAVLTAKDLLRAKGVAQCPRCKREMDRSTMSKDHYCLPCSRIRSQEFRARKKAANAKR